MSKRLMLIIVLALAGCDDTGSSRSSKTGTVIIIPGDTIAPNAPTDLDVEMLSVATCTDHVVDARMRLTWLDNADNEDGFIVKCGTSGYELPDQILEPDITIVECYPITIDSSDSAGFGVAAFNEAGVSDMIRMNFNSMELAGLCP